MITRAWQNARGYHSPHSSYHVRSMEGKNGEKITLQIIADTFGCSKKTAGRDLKEINKKYSLSYECSRVDGEIFIKR